MAATTRKIDTGWRPPGYKQARQGAIDAWSALAGWRVFRRDAAASPEFQRTLDVLRDHDVYYEPKVLRYWQLHQLAEAAIRPGTAVAEFGVYRGATARLLAEVAARRAPGARIHLLDTFAGMPSAQAYDYSGEDYRPGDLGDVDIAAVRRLMDMPGVEPRFHVGMFSDTLPAVDEPAELSLVHIDSDLYDSLMQACDWAYPRTRAGGMIVFDDYGSEDCPGASRAIEEFFAPRPEEPIVLPTGQALVVKSA